MNQVVMISSLVLVAVIQAILPSWMYMGQAKAPLLLGCMLYYALTRSRTAVVTAAILAGLLQDALGLIPLGFSSLVFVLIGLSMNRYREKIFGEHWVTHIILGMAASLTMTILLYILLLSSGLRSMSVLTMLVKATGTMLLGLAAIPLVFMSIQWLDHKMGNIEFKEI